MLDNDFFLGSLYDWVLAHVIQVVSKTRRKWLLGMNRGFMWWCGT